ncbi:MAG: metallophosphoesterase, partial [Rectinema sp.]|nr:metallophosphoesterase [Rectinema sp.]
MERKTMAKSPAIFKILHMSDLHLGKSLRGHDLGQDQENALAQIVQHAMRAQPDLVLMSGDIFDRSIPPEGAQSQFGHFMADLRRVLPPE